MSCQARPRGSDRLRQHCSNPQQNRKKTKILGWKLVAPTCLWLIHLRLPFACAQQHIFSLLAQACVQSWCSWGAAQSADGPRISEGMCRWFLSLECSSCVIRPRSDPTCPDVPPHPSSCTSVTHTLMYRWWSAACKLAWPALWFSEDGAEPPLPRGPALSTVHYSFTFTFIRILFRLLLI